MALALIAGVVLFVQAPFPAPRGRPSPAATQTELPRIHVVGSRLYAGSKVWRAWGMNWGIADHQPVLTYFDNPTARNHAKLDAELDIAQRLGVNAMRIPLELGQVMRSPTQARASVLTGLARLLKLARDHHIYLDITGNLVWRPKLVPAWYDRLSEQARWQVQARFWRAVASIGKSSSAVLCYELTSEPAISDQPKYYIGDLGGYTFVQIVAHPRGRNPVQLARAWTRLLVSAVHSQDKRPVTIGLVPDHESSFSPPNLAGLLDVLVMHEYPVTGGASTAIAIVKRFASFKKPVLIGETFVLADDAATQRAFLVGASRYVAGIFEFFDGRDPSRMRVTTWADAFYHASLVQFIALRKTLLSTR